MASPRYCSIVTTSIESCEKHEHNVLPMERVAFKANELGIEGYKLESVRRAHDDLQRRKIEFTLWFRKIPNAN